MNILSDACDPGKKAEVAVLGKYVLHVLLYYHFSSSFFSLFSVSVSFFISLIPHGCLIPIYPQLNSGWNRIFSKTRILYLFVFIYISGCADFRAQLMDIKAADEVSERG